MFTAACPSCGAKVSLRASQSTTAVCGFCKSTLVRDAEALKRMGVYDKRKLFGVTTLDVVS